MLGKCSRGEKISSLWHAGLALLGPCAKGVQFFCPSRTYQAIPYYSGYGSQFFSSLLKHSSQCLFVYIVSTFWLMCDSMRKMGSTQSSKIVTMYCKNIAQQHFHFITKWTIKICIGYVLKSAEVRTLVSRR